MNYKMKKEKSGVLAGNIHPHKFEAGKTYTLDDDLAGKWKDDIEESNEEPVQPLDLNPSEDLHEMWLDKDPAILRQGITPIPVINALDQSPVGDVAPPKTPEEFVQGADQGHDPEGEDAKSKKKK